MPGTSLLLHLLSPLYGAGAEDRWGEKAEARGQEETWGGAALFCSDERDAEEEGTQVF